MPVTDVTRGTGKVGRVSYARVVVPLDGSTLSESALWPATALSWYFGAELHLLGIAENAAEVDRLAQRLDPLASNLDATHESRLGPDVPAAILAAVAERAGTLLCMASHGRGLSRVVFGSVAESIFAASDEPVVIVGPRFDRSRSLWDGPVLACVDGSPGSEDMLPIVASWAKTLGLPMALTTVAEPIPEPMDQRPYHRIHGPGSDAHAYVEGLATAWRDQVGRAVPLAIYDPLGPAEGLVHHLEGDGGGLLAVNTHSSSGLVRAVLGSQTTAIISRSPIPVLVVPRR